MCGWIKPVKCEKVRDDPPLGGFHMKLTELIYAMDVWMPPLVQHRHTSTSYCIRWK